MATITCVDCGVQCDRATKQAKRCFSCVDKRQTFIAARCLDRRRAGIPARKPMTSDERWQNFAARAVNFAKAIGALPSLEDGLTACVDCGDEATCYDHRDYSRPLDVAPVCMVCNSRRGSAIAPSPRIEQPKRKAA